MLSTLRSRISAVYGVPGTSDGPVAVVGGLFAHPATDEPDDAVDGLFLALSYSDVRASGRRLVVPPRPVDGSMTCAAITVTGGGTAAHGGFCVWVNRAAVVELFTVDHDVDETIRYARRVLPDIVHRD
ncbi:hypothetical protein [Actinocatenispora sera]|jgi:hypothetical protein|nr:hypothetical protein [Actinocatenispora sera]